MRVPGSSSPILFTHQHSPTELSHCILSYPPAGLQFGMKVFPFPFWLWTVLANCRSLIHLVGPEHDMVKFWFVCMLFQSIFNPWTYKQIHTPTGLQGEEGGLWLEPPWVLVVTRHTKNTFDFVTRVYLIACDVIWKIRLQGNTWRQGNTAN